MTTTHTHEWQYVEEQQVFEGFTITSESEPDDEGIVWIAIDEDSDWQNMGDVQTQRITCKECDLEREISFQVEWPGMP